MSDAAEHREDEEEDQLDAWKCNSHNADALAAAAAGGVLRELKFPASRER